MLTLILNGNRKKDCLSSHSLEAVILNLGPVNLWEKAPIMC